MINSLSREAETILNKAAGIVIAIDVKERIQFINEKGCELLECERESVIGKNWFETFLPDVNREDLRELFQQILHTGSFDVEEYENSLRTAKGNIRFVKWYHTIALYNDGEAKGVLGLGEDVSDRNMLRHQLSVLEETKRQQLVAAVLEGQEKERRELAHELHDNVNQILTTCKLLLEQELTSGNASPFVYNTTQYLQQAINEIRDISHRLNPEQLSSEGLAYSIAELAQRINLPGKLDVSVHIDGREQLAKMDPVLALSLFRILQEALNNVVKYAVASAIEIHLAVNDRAVDLEVRDNGIGFDLKKVSRGFGLRGIYSRVELHFGKVYINSAPGEGCTISVHIPYEPVPIA